NRKSIGVESEAMHDGRKHSPASMCPRLSRVPVRPAKYRAAYRLLKVHASLRLLRCFGFGHVISPGPKVEKTTGKLNGKQPARGRAPMQGRHGALIVPGGNGGSAGHSGWCASDEGRHINPKL